MPYLGLISRLNILDIHVHPLTHGRTLVSHQDTHATDGTNFVHSLMVHMTLSTHPYYR